MPQVIALALVGAGLWAGYRWLSKESARIAENLRTAEEELRMRRAEARDEALSRQEPKEVGTLVADPETGIYKLDQRKLH